MCQLPAAPGTAWQQHLLQQPLLPGGHVCEQLSGVAFPAMPCVQRRGTSSDRPLRTSRHSPSVCNNDAEPSCNSILQLFLCEACRTGWQGAVFDGYKCVPNRTIASEPDRGACASRCAGCHIGGCWQ